MERLLFLSDIMERYRYKDPKNGRRIMREMGAQGRPLFVRESQVEAYDILKTTPPETPKRKAPAKVRTPQSVDELLLKRI